MSAAQSPTQEQLEEWEEAPEYAAAANAVPALVAEVKRLRRVINTPEIAHFTLGVVREAQHQRERWGAEHDAGKENADWFWLIGYLAGKALAAANAGNNEKALHHTVSTAAALANWHAALSGENNEMRPGIDSNATAGLKATEEQGEAKRSTLHKSPSLKENT